MKPKIIVHDISLNKVSIREHTPKINLSNIANMSKSNIGGYAGFQLSVSKDKVTSPLDGTYTGFPPEGYSGFISQNTDTVIINCRALSDINEIIISFDDVDKQYAQFVTFYNQRNESVQYAIRQYEKEWVFELNESLDILAGELFSIVFNNWSVPNRSFKIRAIFTTDSGDFTIQDIISFECSEHSLDSNLSISPGVCEQYADIVFYDRNELLKNTFIENPKKIDYDISIIAEDTIIGKYEIQDWNTDDGSSEISLTCRDKVYRLSQINFNVIDMLDRTVHDWLAIIFNQAGIFSWKYLNSDIEYRCKDIIIPNSYLSKINLLDALNKICAVVFLRIYTLNNMFIVTTSVDIAAG